MAINKVDYFGETLLDLTSDTVSAADLLEGKTAHVASGEVVTGTMPDNGSVDISISAVSEEASIPEGYHDGSGKVSISAEEQAKVVPGNIVKGVTILGVSGTAETGGDSDIDKLVDGSLTMLVSDAASVRSYTFYYCSNLSTVNLPLATSIGSSAFSNCSSLTTIDFPQATKIDDYAFRYCSNLSTVNLPLATDIGNGAFRYCSNLSTVNLPLATSIGSYTFHYCSNLSTVNLPLATSIGSYTFYYCSKLSTAIFRSEKMATLQNISAFSSTPIKSGTGYIYVPKSLVDTYKSATNWSTFANQFRAIEDYPDICGE